MDNLGKCTNLGIEIKFEKMLIKWNKITFFLFVIIEVVGIVATLINNQEWGILFIPFTTGAIKSH